MAKTAHLTWGLSLCRLKIPSALLDSRLDKLSLSTCSFFSVPSGSRLRSRPSLRQPCPQASLQIPHNDDIEIDLVIGPPQLASRCVKGRDKITTAGGNFLRLSFYRGLLTIFCELLCNSDSLVDFSSIFFSNLPLFRHAFYHLSRIACPKSRRAERFKAPQTSRVAHHGEFFIHSAGLWLSHPKLSLPFLMQFQVSHVKLMRLQ